jgi:uncharacterized membrane-anchored protein
MRPQLIYGFIITMRAFLSRLSLALASALLFLHAGASAQNASAQQEIEAASKAAFAAARQGPDDVTLGDQATLKLPHNMFFVPRPQAERLMQAYGNGKDPRLQGVIFPEGDGGWFMTVRYEASGYVKDDDAKEWNADDLLQSYREGTEASNEERVMLGIPAIEIIGWAEKPAYDATSHRLVWAMSSRDKGAPAGAPQGVNYNTYALGREGYFSLNLVTGLAELPQHKSAAHTLLGALDYKQGKRYADFDAKTDHVAEYGLAALVVGVAAKKLGFIALLVAFFAKFAKVILLGVAVLGAAFVKFFGKRKAMAAAAASGEPPRV